MRLTQLSFLTISVLFTVAGCSDASISYPLLEGKREIEFPEGYVGCEWEPHILQMQPPLSGKLKFNAINCNQDKRYRPKYGHKKVFSIDSNNNLKIGHTPLDPNDKKTKRQSYAYLSVITHNGDPKKVMHRFLAKADNKHCKLEVTPSGRWQIGLSKDYYEELGYSFPYYNQMCPKDIDYSEGSMPCLSDNFFPNPDYPYSNTCSAKTQDGFIYNAFRVSGTVLFAFRQDELESHPENVRVLDPYSVKYIP